jgi:hypothetical protein
MGYNDDFQKQFYEELRKEQAMQTTQITRYSTVRWLRSKSKDGKIMIEGEGKVVRVRLGFANRHTGKMSPTELLVRSGSVVHYINPRDVIAVKHCC